MNEPKSTVAATVNSLNPRGARRTTWARLRAGFMVVFGAILVAAGFVVLSESPASADNCKQLVKSIGDLGDSKKMADCLRTGGNWSRTIGTTVAVSGTAIALAGLSKPRLKPPPEVQDIVQDMNACTRAKRRAKRVSDLETQLSTLESDVLKEFEDCADGTRKFNQLYRDLKELDYQMYKAVGEARLANFTYWGMWAVGLSGKIGAIGKFANAMNLIGGGGAIAAIPGVAGVPAVVVAGAWSGEIQAAIAGMSTAANKFSSDYVKYNMPRAIAPGSIRPGDPGAPAVGGLSTGLDIMARELQANLEKHLQRLVTLYCQDAQQFNTDWEQWGRDRREQVSNLRHEINDEIRRWKEEAAACPELADAVPPAEQNVVEVAEWLIPQAQTNWAPGASLWERLGGGPGWLFGGYFLPFGLGGTL